MLGRRLPGWRGVALWILLGILALALLAIAFAWSGLYNVAARTGHWAITRSFIEFALRQSVATHSMGIEVPQLEDENLVRLGAGHFATGCAPCHGAPGLPRSPIVRQMTPAPPDLAHASRDWRTHELFWIVKNGLKYTGMPAWVAPERDEEIWSVVAFLLRLPDLEPAAYAALAGHAAGARAGATSDPARLAGPPAAVAECARCHGGEAAPPVSRLVPRLDVLPARYMAAALQHYAEGLRPSGIMQPIAAGLSQADIERLAAYYADLQGASGNVTVREAAAPARIEAGRRIAATGVPAEGIPPCLACHGTGGSALFPRLAGQHAPYIAGQLRLWQRGLRAESVTGAIMATIARRLTSAQIEAVAAYFESLPAGSHDRVTSVADDAFRSESP